MRRLNAPHRKLALGGIGLHEHQALPAVVNQGIDGNLDHVTRRRDVHGGGDVLRHPGYVLLGLSTYPLMTAVC